MHELSIALSMIDVAAEEAERLGGGRVAAIHLRLGPLSGVIRDALLGAWELACESSPLAGCRLVIEDVPITIDCPTCRIAQPARSMQDLTCTACGSPAVCVLSGREMEVVALEVVDEAP
ncbi:MAG TPA: hydrogenase maturation nickel metallochaperone HypA [Tepidisphaeraceae bacterium]|jgi:hydrogenase nickel incorporation protein HypA/HybF